MFNIHLPSELAQRLEHYGWITTGIEEFRIAYTIGLMEKFGHPEIVIHGLDMKMSHHFMIQLVDSIAKGARYEAGKTYDHVAANYPTLFSSVNSANHDTWFAMAQVAKGDAPETLEMVQMVWCDLQGRFPKDPNFDPKFIPLQKLFDRPVPMPESTHDCTSKNCVMCGKKKTTIH